MFLLARRCVGFTFAHPPCRGRLASALWLAAPFRSEPACADCPLSLDSGERGARRARCCMHLGPHCTCLHTPCSAAKASSPYGARRFWPEAADLHLRCLAQGIHRAYSARAPTKTVPMAITCTSADDAFPAPLPAQLLPWLYVLCDCPSCSVGRHPVKAPFSAPAP